ncbi:MAG: GntR family transcriptional regulator [Brevibacillus sp.]|nr:GntR family transcriptional regulator [Brevibacillus sp.]
MAENKYQIIANEIRERILTGYYPSDQPIPDELSLAEQFGCSRMTMKKALEVLVLEGLLYRKRGHGTFILKSALQQDRVNVLDKETKGLTETAKGKKVTSHVVQFNVEFPIETVANYLAIETTDPVYKIIRVRYVDGEPFVIEKTYMPVQRVPGINEEVLRGSIYQYIQGKLGLTIASTHKMIRADKPDELDREYLKCAFDDPVLEVEQIVFLGSGQPFEYSFSRHRYDKFVFKTVNIKW